MSLLSSVFHFGQIPDCRINLTTVERFKIYLFSCEFRVCVCVCDCCCGCGRFAPRGIVAHGTARMPIFHTSAKENLKAFALSTVNVKFADSQLPLTTGVLLVSFLLSQCATVHITTNATRSCSSTLTSRPNQATHAFTHMPWIIYHLYKLKFVSK